MIKMTNPLDLLLTIAKEKHVGDKWTNQPLYLVKILANSSKGDLAEEFIMTYFRELGVRLISS